MNHSAAEVAATNGTRPYPQNRAKSKNQGFTGAEVYDKSYPARADAGQRNIRFPASPIEHDELFDSSLTVPHLSAVAQGETGRHPEVPALSPAGRGSRADLHNCVPRSTARIRLVLNSSAPPIASRRQDPAESQPDSPARLDALRSPRHSCSSPVCRAVQPPRTHPALAEPWASA